MRDHVAQAAYFIQLTLVVVHSEVVLGSHLLKFLKVAVVGIFVFATYDHIIDVSKGPFWRVVNQVYQAIHDTLESRHGVGDAKRDSSELKQLANSFESCISFLIVAKRYLMVRTLQIQPTEDWYLARSCNRVSILGMG